MKKLRLAMVSLAMVGLSFGPTEDAAAINSEEHVDATTPIAMCAESPASAGATNDGCCPHPNGQQLQPYEYEEVSWCVGECKANET